MKQYIVDAFSSEPLAIKEIRFFRDYRTEAELIDGSRMEMELKPCRPEERKRRK